MANKNYTQNQNNITITLEAESKHNTSIGPNGEILYDCPIEIHDQQDLNNYGISWSDCRTLSFNGSARVAVYFMKVESRAVAEYHWSYLDSLHSKEYAAARCMIPGLRKPFIKCPTTVSCATCPYKDARKPPVVSWDQMIDEDGYGPGADEPVEREVMAKAEYQAIRAMMDAEDARIAKVLELRTLRGYTVKQIVRGLRLSEPRIYQLLARAKAIGAEYRRNNG